MQKISILFFALLVFGCDTPDDKQDNDAGGTDGGTDLQQGDVSPRPDLSADTSPDTAQPDMTEKDMGTTRAMAIVGERCEPKNRMGIVHIGRSRQISVYARLFDGPDPTVGDPELADAQCSFFDTPVCACDIDQVCNTVGECVSRPNLLTDAKIEISNDAESLTIETTNGGLSDSVTLDGNSFALEVSWSGQTIVVPAMEIPSALEGLDGTLDGSYDSPNGLEIVWDSPGGDTRVFSRTDINHHVSTPTFVECDVEAASGKMAISGEMLKPLSVSTGLEFQGVEHVRFAAAQTPDGCVEFRYLSSGRPNL